MTRVICAALAVAAISLAPATTALSRSTATVTLRGTVGPGFAISLTRGRQRVTSLKAGTYKFVIADKASIHGFSLDGPHGFAKDMTPVRFVGTKSFTLNLKAGKYKFYCPAHEPTMFGHFTVK